MNIVEPIRDKCDIEKIKTILKSYKKRDLLLFLLGINSGLRISDLLSLKIRDVVDVEFLEIREKKTGKKKRFPILPHLYMLFEDYCKNKELNDWLFPSQKGNKAISRVQAYRIINSVSKKAGLEEKIGTHSLRKTFGYHFYKQTKDIALLQTILNHSSPKITLKYIGINQEIVDEELKKFYL